MCSQVLGAQAEAAVAELGARSRLAAPLLHQRKRRGGSDLWLQCGHHASASGFVCINVYNVYQNSSAVVPGQWLKQSFESTCEV